MKQRALRFGVLSNPYRAVEPGQEFDHPDAMNWAEPVEDDPAPVPDPVPDPVPEAGDGLVVESAPVSKRKKAAPAPAPDEPDPI